MSLHPSAFLFLSVIVWATSTIGQEPFIVAHRGASYDAPENTIPAFELAWKKNADAIEGDFYLTKDNQIVCIHDKSTKRYCRQNLDVAKSTFDQLRRLDVGTYKNPKFRDTRIPSIQEVLATVPEGKKIYVEIKCGPEIIPELQKQLKASGLKPKQIVIIAFNSNVIKKIKSSNPEYKAYWLTSFKEKKGKLSPTVDQALATLREIRADGISTNHKDLTQKFLSAVKQKGFEFHVWTVNEPDVAKRVQAWGVQSITTDRPALIGKSISE